MPGKRLIFTIYIYLVKRDRLCSYKTRVVLLCCFNQHSNTGTGKEETIQERGHSIKREAEAYSKQEREGMQRIQ